VLLVVNSEIHTMGFLDTILSKLGFAAAEASSAPTAAPTDAARVEAARARASAPPSAAAITVVDVMGKLAGLAAANPQKLDWKVSIVDLLKLLDLDSSYTARKELAAELGCPADLMGDSAKMNVWLHKTVLKKLAENGGNIPAELLD